MSDFIVFILIFAVLFLISLRIERFISMATTQTQVLQQIADAQTALTADLATTKAAVIAAIDSAATNGQDATPVANAVTALVNAQAAGLQDIATTAQATVTPANPTP
jgi:cell division protein FtsB